MGVSIKDLDNDNASFSEGTLTDVEAVNDGLELAGEGTRWSVIFNSSTNVDNYVSNLINDGGATWSYNSIEDALKVYKSSSYVSSAEYQFGTLIDSSIYSTFRIAAKNIKGKIYIKFRYEDDSIDDSWIISGWGPSTYTIKEVEFPNNGLKIKGIILNSKSSTDGTEIYIKSEIVFDPYSTQGNRMSPQLDLSAVNDVASSNISWTETLNSQTITIETSVDGGSTWQTATNGGAIPNLPANPTTLDVRQILDTNDTTVTPVLESLEVDIDTAEENTDSGSFTATLEQEDFRVVEEDSTQLTSAEDSDLTGFSFNDSGSFNIDAENWYTMVWEVFTEDSLTSNIEYNQEGWIQNPKATSSWQKIDENKEDLWTKVDKNTADWNKG